MDPAAALRALALAASVGCAACGGASPAAEVAAAHPRGVSGSAVVTSGEVDEVHARVAAVLSASGRPCRATRDRVMCEGDGERSASFYVVYRAYPARLLFGSPWLLRGPCSEATAALNAFNWEYDELGASCDERGTVIVQGAYFVPAAGLTGDDVVTFARWWTLVEVRALQSSPVAPLLQ